MINGEESYIMYNLEPIRDSKPSSETKTELPWDYLNTHRLKRNTINYNKFIKLQPFIIVFVDVSATAVTKLTLEKQTELSAYVFRNTDRKSHNVI